MTFVLGLTGSIGMGKSTTAAMFAEKGIPVWDADQAVHRLYAPLGAAVGPMAALFPDAVQGGAIDRDVLKSIIAADPSALARIEAVVHPLVSADRTAFLHAHHTAALVVFDVPLLFETEAEGFFDAIAVVTAPADVQTARVLARPGMTRERLETLLARQMPDAEKRARADYIIQTTSIDSAKTAVDAIIAEILAKSDKAGRKRNPT